MQTFTYVDNSNVFIEGQRVSAVQKGMARTINDAIDRRIIDFDWRLDYGNLHSLLCGDEGEIGAANLWGSPPPGDSFWKMVERKGFRVETYARNLQGKAKKVDVAIAHQITKDAYTRILPIKVGAEITLVAGDKDYVPVVKDLVEGDFKVIVAFWDHAARELKELATEFFRLDPFLDHLTARW